MHQAFVIGIVPHAKPPLKLRDFLVPETSVPKRRKTWQELKAVIILALGGPRKD